MARLILICIAFSGAIFGTIVHFWILHRLENAGVRVKYFANVSDGLRAYKIYRDLAREQQWPLWPSYAVFSGYLAVLAAGLSFFFGSPLLDIAKWIK